MFPQMRDTLPHSADRRVEVDARAGASAAIERRQEPV
jgi:hypothetical protein